jgi:predicted N-formylglutamate amidohydrolase
MTEMFRILSPDEGDPVTIESVDASSAVVIVCEHASKRLPRALGTLGLSNEALNAHIAWDPGALAVARAMAKSLDATLIYQNYSRLAYDCNRPPEAPDAMPSISEIFEIPGNMSLNDEQRQARTDAIYRPFQQALATLIADRKAARRQTVLVTVHSFTPVYRGVRRAVELGILHDSDSRLADGMLARAAAHGNYIVERNQPYGPEDGVTHTLREHGLANGLMNVMIEVRNDLISNETGQVAMAGFLADLISAELTVDA